MPAVPVEVDFEGHRASGVVQVVLDDVEGGQDERPRPPLADALAPQDRARAHLVAGVDPHRRGHQLAIAQLEVLADARRRQEPLVLGGSDLEGGDALLEVLELPPAHLALGAFPGLELLQQLAALGGLHGADVDDLLADPPQAVLEPFELTLLGPGELAQLGDLPAVVRDLLLEGDRHVHEGERHVHDDREAAKDQEAGGSQDRSLGDEHRVRIAPVRRRWQGNLSCSPYRLALLVANWSTYT